MNAPLIMVMRLIGDAAHANNRAEHDRPPSKHAQPVSVQLRQVETPVLERSAGGAEARPFLTFHNALGRSFALRIATGGRLGTAWWRHPARATA